MFILSAYLKRKKIVFSQFHCCIKGFKLNTRRLDVLCHTHSIHLKWIQNVNAIGTRAHTHTKYQINMEWQHTLPVPFACISNLFYTCCIYTWAIFARVRAIWERKHPNDAVHVPPLLSTTLLAEHSFDDIYEPKQLKRCSWHGDQTAEFACFHRVSQAKNCVHNIDWDWKFFHPTLHLIDSITGLKFRKKGSEHR